MAVMIGRICEGKHERILCRTSNQMVIISIHEHAIGVKRIHEGFALARINSLGQSRTAAVGLVHLKMVEIVVDRC